MAGYDTDKSPIYVGRACVTVPAKVIPSKQECYVSFNGNEILKQNFEYLVGSGFKWVECSNGHIPEGAVVAGNDQSEEVHYVGRAHHMGSLTPGKIHRTHGCLYIAYGGHEVSIKQYEVLIAVQQRCKLFVKNDRSYNKNNCLQLNGLVVELAVQLLMVQS